MPVLYLFFFVSGLALRYSALLDLPCLISHNRIGERESKRQKKVPWRSAHLMLRAPPLISFSTLYRIRTRAPLPVPFVIPNGVGFPWWLMRLRLFGAGGGGYEMIWEFKIRDYLYSLISWIRERREGVIGGLALAVHCNEYDKARTSEKLEGSKLWLVEPAVECVVIRLRVWECDAMRLAFEVTRTLHLQLYLHRLSRSVVAMSMRWPW